MEQEESDSTSCLPITKQCQSLCWMNVLFKDVFDELESLNRYIFYQHVFVNNLVRPPLLKATSPLY